MTRWLNKRTGVVWTVGEVHERHLAANPDFEPVPDEIQKPEPPARKEATPAPTAAPAAPKRKATKKQEG